MFSFFRCVLPAEVPRPTHPNLFFAAEFSVKVLVTVKRVVDYNVKVHAKADKSGPDIEAAKMSMNPFDEIAVEAAVRLKKTGATDEVVALTVGPAKAVDQLRTAMAMGADRAIHVTLEAAADPAAAARIIAAVAKNEAPDLILMGKQAIDDDSAQAPAMVSAILNLPFAACADALRVENGTAFVRRETDEGLMEVSSALPCVVSADCVGRNSSSASSIRRSSIRPFTNRITAARTQIPARTNKMIERVFLLIFIMVLYAEVVRGCNSLKQKDFLIFGRYFQRKRHIKSYRIKETPENRDGTESVKGGDGMPVAYVYGDTWQGNGDICGNGKCRECLAGE